MFFVGQLHKVTVVNTDAEKSLLRSFLNDIEFLTSNFYPSVVLLDGDTNKSKISA